MGRGEEEGHGCANNQGSNTQGQEQGVLVHARGGRAKWL